MRNRTRVHAARVNYGQGVELRLMQSAGEGRIAIATNIEFTVVDDCAYYEPVAMMDITGAQELMDSLWAAGVRPTEGTGSAGSLAATQSHLQDMRRLVFGTIPLPEEDNAVHGTRRAEVDHG